MKQLLWIGLTTLALTGNPMAGWAQVPTLPVMQFSRRADELFMDSISRQAKRRYEALSALPQTPTTDTLRFKTLFFLGGVYKYWYGRRDSTLYFGEELTRLARQRNNLYFDVNGLLVQEHFYRNGERNTPKALRLNLAILQAIPFTAFYEVVRYRVTINLSDLYSFSKDYATALRYLNQAQQLLANDLVYANPVTSFYFRAEIEQHLGALYKRWDRFSDSEAHYLKAEQLLVNTSAGNRAFIYDDLAELYLQYKRYEQALPYAKKAEDIWNGIKSPYESKGWGTLACIYAGLGQDERAHRYAHQVLKLPASNKFIREQAYQALYQVYEHQQDWKNRALCYEKYVAIRDTIALDQQSLELTAIQNEAELDQLTLQNKQAQALQTGQLRIIQERATLDRRQAGVRADILTQKARLTEQQRLLETERAQRATHTLARQQAQQKLEQETFIRENHQQQRIRLFLLSGLAALCLFTIALAALYRRNQRQKRQIQQLNAGLEQTVLARTAELLTANEDLQRANVAIRSSNARIIQAQESERQRIAADLHDDLGGTLATLRRRLADIRQQLPDSPTARQLDDLEPMILKSNADLRRIAHNLMPPEFARLGLHQALDQLVASQPKHPTRFSFITSGQPRELPVDTALNVYRIVSELIQNINKHAQANRAAVQTIYQADSLRITVDDDGLGNRTDALISETKGIGLKNSILRAEYIGATLWQDASEAGTLVVLDIPYSSTPDAVSPTPPNSFG